MATKEQKAANAETMCRHIISYKASGLSILRYCKNKEISVHRFNYWFYRRKKRQGASAERKGFSRVKPVCDQPSVPPRISRQPTVEVTLPNGTRVIFFEPQPLELFKSLL